MVQFLANFPNDFWGDKKNGHRIMCKKKSNFLVCTKSVRWSLCGCWSKLRAEQLLPEKHNGSVSLSWLARLKGHTCDDEKIALDSSLREFYELTNGLQLNFKKLQCKATNFMTFPNKYWTISWCLTKLGCITFSPSLPSARLIQRSIQTIELHCQSSRQLSRWNVQKVID